MVTPPPNSPIILHPASRHPRQGSSGSEVQDDGDEERVSVPALRWAARLVSTL